MDLIGTLLVLLGAWLVLAVPVALLVGRFLRVGAQKNPRRASEHPQLARLSADPLP